MSTQFRIEKNWVSPIALICLFLLVAWLFREHLMGRLTFPWDFQGGYFTNAVARMRDGSFLAPPLWLPWGGFGLPGYLSLQDGTWYLPQWLFDFFGLRYDLVGATRLQIAHVFIAGAGTWYLCRWQGFSAWASILAATGMVLSGSFYSNAQHVDIVRGAAMLPWMFLATDWCLKRRSTIAVAVLAGLTWQFLVGAYPGQIVAAAYCLPMLVALRAWDMPRFEWIQGLGLLMLAAALGVGLSAVKFLPVAADLSNIRQSAGQVSQVDASILSTLLFDFDVDYLPNDVTMRDLFMVLPVLLLAPFGFITLRMTKVGLGLVIISGLFISDPFGLAGKLPLFSVSRFHLSDFRPSLHLGMALLAAGAFDAIAMRKSRPLQLVFATLLSAATFFALLSLGWKLGVEQHELLMVGLLATATAAVSASLWWGDGEHGRWTALVGVVVVLLAAWSGIRHVERNARVWQTPRSDATETALFGAPLSQLVGQNRHDALTFRPARLLFSSLPADRGQLYDARYGQGWLGEKFSAFGYSDLKGAQTYQHFYAGAKQAGSTLVRQQIDWLLRSSGLVINAVSLEKAVSAGLSCGSNVCGPDSRHDSRIRPILFLENGEVWEVNSTAPMTVIQNETWYPGWQSQLCNGGRCQAGPIAKDMTGLRRWDLPQGRYRFVSFYRPPAWGLAKLISWGAVISLFILLLVSAIKRYKLVVSQRI